MADEEKKDPEKVSEVEDAEEQPVEVEVTIKDIAGDLDDEDDLFGNADDETPLPDEDIEANEGDDEDALLFALPPRGVQAGEGQVEVSNSPAFQCLDELFSKGELTGTQVAQLKAKYMELYNTLKQSRESEFDLLQKAKKYNSNLESQQAELAKADTFPENLTTEVQKMREQLLKYNNEAMQSAERNYEFDYKIECLEEENRIVKREWERMPKSEEFEKRIKMLEASNVELSQEINQHQRECKKLRETIVELEEQETELKEQYNDVKEVLERCKGELVACNSLPTQYAKEADKIRKLNIELEKHFKELDGQSVDLSSHVGRLEKRKMVLEEEEVELQNNRIKQEIQLADRQAEFDRVNKELELFKEKEITLAADKATVEMNLRHLNLERRNVHDTHSRKLREKDRELRNLKKAQLQYKVAEESLSLVKQVHEKTKANFEMFPKDDGSLFARRKQLQGEVEQLKRAQDQESQQGAVEHVKVQQSVQEEERLLYELNDLRIEVVELTRLGAIKADEREQKARDFMRAEMRYHRAVEDLKAKQLQINDHKKKYQEMGVKLKDFAKLYDIIKNERNKLVTLIQTTTQKAAEMREKDRILENEIEILRTNLTDKENLLKKQRMRHANSIVMRDSLRNEVSKQRCIEEDYQKEREQLRLDIQRLNSMVNQAEEAMVQLRKSSDKAVQHRNDRAVQLIERNEEVYILQEKVKIQESMIRHGEIELQSREEEIRFLQRHQQEESRSLKLLRNNVPKKRQLEDELTTVQIQLSTAQDRMLELEAQSEDPEKEGRLRYLEGNDPTPVEMQTRHEQLEVRLAAKEEQLLEKELLFDAVQRLVSVVHNKALSGREDTLTLAKDVNSYKSRMNTVTKKMKATTAELTMYMSTAMRMQQELKEKEDHLEQCYKRLERGEPPSQEIEQDWMRHCAAEERKFRERESVVIASEEASQFQLPGGGSTTAEPRPNAYIPEDEVELPIPRPYGGHAPFRPTEQGSNMRHIRKPRPKPIEI